MHMNASWYSSHRPPELLHVLLCLQYIQQATIVKNSEIHALAKWKEHESRVNLALIRSKLILSYIYKILDGVHFI